MPDSLHTMLSRLPGEWRPPVGPTNYALADAEILKAKVAELEAERDELKAMLELEWQGQWDHHETGILLCQYLADLRRRVQKGET